MSEDKKTTRDRSQEEAPSVDPAQVEVGKDQVAAAKIQNPDTLQHSFPSLEGDVETEVSKRNLHNASGKRFVRQFVLLKREWNGDDYQHQANIKHVREEQLHMGLRATGDVVFDGEEQHPTDEASVVLTYSGPTVPAAVAGDAGLQPRYVLQQQFRDERDYDPTPRGIDPKDVADNRGGSESQVKDQ
jgi:hypothetical protein